MSRNYIIFTDSPTSYLDLQIVAQTVYAIFSYYLLITIVKYLFELEEHIGLWDFCMNYSGLPSMLLFYLFATFWGKPKKVLFFATFCLHLLLFATFLIFSWNLFFLELSFCRNLFSYLMHKTKFHLLSFIDIVMASYRYL